MGSVVCLVGPNMRYPMEELARMYERETGAAVVVHADEVRGLITAMEQGREADVFVTHDPFLAVARAKGIAIREAWTVGSVWPVIAVPRGNPKKIASLEDLARPGLKLGLTDADNSISGQIITRMIEKAGIAKGVEANVTLRALVGRGVAASLLTGEIDAAVVWNVVAFGAKEKVDAVEIAPRWRPAPGTVALHPTLGRLELDYVRVTLATLSRAKDARAAGAFGAFAASPQGQAVFARYGFGPIDPTRPTLPDAKP